MKLPSGPVNPLLGILAEEAADLPLKASREARKIRSLRVKRQRQLAICITVFLCCLAVWIVSPLSKVEHKPIAIQSPEVPIVVAEPIAPLSPQPSEVVIVRTEYQALNESLPLPSGLTEEQENVLKAASGLPLLLVRDGTGKVVRIHAIERIPSN